jgi:hypothetical protein
MRGRQRVVAGQAYAIVSRGAGKGDEFICDSPCDPAASVDWGNKHTNHFALSIIETLDRTGADDCAFSGRAQKESPMGVDGLRVIDVRQARINEVSYKGIRVIMKMLTPNGFDEPPSRGRIAGSERSNCPIWFEARERRLAGSRSQ